MEAAQANRAPATADRAATGRAALAGALAAGAALAVTEVVAAAEPVSPSLLIAVETWFVDTFAASLKQMAVDLFGTGDKTALAIGTLLVALALGAALGVAEALRRGAGALGLAAFGVAGVAATTHHSQGNETLAVVAAILGVGVGVGVLWLLLDRFGVAVAPWRLAGVASSVSAPPVLPTSVGPAPAAGTPAAGSPATVWPVASPRAPALALADRRDVLVWTGAVAVASLATAALARALRASRAAPLLDLPDRLPAAVAADAVPSTTATAAPGGGAAAPFATEGLSPYITPIASFFRIDTSLRAPLVDERTWRLRITGLVDREVEYSYAELLERDLVEQVVTLSCVSNEVGGDLVGNARWRGVPLRELLAEAGVQPEATQVVGQSIDGFTAGFPTATLDDPDRPALVAVGMNGVVLPRAHGFPARIVVSGLYGYVSAVKWLTEIRLTRWDDEDGYWIPRGWSKEAPVKTQSRIDVPRGGRIAAGTQAVAGVAWAPNRGIAKVEVRVDEGEWREATLGPVASDDTWVQWHLAWEAEPGEHTLTVRATDGDGQTQTSEESRPDPDGATGWHQRRVTVSR